MRASPTMYKSSREKAYFLIKEAIVMHKYKPGQFLNEIHLAKELSLSRTPIREALHALEAEGFLTLLPNRGAQVAAITKKDVEELFELRLLFEGLAGEKLVTQKNYACLDLMEKMLDKQRDCCQNNDLVRFVEYDRKFHLTLIRAAENEKMYKIYDELRDHLLRLGLQAIQSTELMHVAYADHIALLKALRNGALEEYHNIIVDHLSKTRNAVAQIIPNLLYS
jgi:DNA-binding GntR family transcriptional regulator